MRKAKFEIEALADVSALDKAQGKIAEVVAAVVRGDASIKDAFAVGSEVQNAVSGFDAVTKAVKAYHEALTGVAGSNWGKSGYQDAFDHVRKLANLKENLLALSAPTKDANKEAKKYASTLKEIEKLSSKMTVAQARKVAKDRAWSYGDDGSDSEWGWKNIARAQRKHYMSPGAFAEAYDDAASSDSDELVAAVQRLARHQIDRIKKNIDERGPWEKGEQLAKETAQAAGLAADKLDVFALSADNMEKAFQHAAQEVESDFKALVTAVAAGEMSVSEALKFADADKGKDNLEGVANKLEEVADEAQELRQKLKGTTDAFSDKEMQKVVKGQVRALHDLEVAASDKAAAAFQKLDAEAKQALRKVEASTNLAAAAVDDRLEPAVDKVKTAVKEAAVAVDAKLEPALEEAAGAAKKITFKISDINELADLQEITKRFEMVGRAAKKSGQEIEVAFDVGTIEGKDHQRALALIDNEYDSLKEAAKGYLNTLKSVRKYERGQPGGRWGTATEAFRWSRGGSDAGAQGYMGAHMEATSKYAASEMRKMDEWASRLAERTAKAAVELNNMSDEALEAHRAANMLDDANNKVGASSEKAAAGFAKQAKEMGKFRRSAGTVLRVASRLSNVFVGLKAKVQTAWAALQVPVRVVRSTAEYAAEVVKAADAVGVTGREMDVFQRVMNFAGIELNQINEALAYFSRNVGKAIDGYGTMRDVFVNFGFDVEYLKENANDIIRLFFEVAQKASELDVSNRSFGLGLIYGEEAARKVGVAAARGSEYLTELVQKVQELERPTEKAWRDAAELHYMFRQIDFAIKGELVDSLSNAKDEIGNLAVAFGEFVDWAIDKVDKWVLAGRREDFISGVVGGKEYEYLEESWRRRARKESAEAANKLLHEFRPTVWGKLGYMFTGGNLGARIRDDAHNKAREKLPTQEELFRRYQKGYYHYLRTLQGLDSPVGKTPGGSRIQFTPPGEVKIAAKEVSLTAPKVEMLGSETVFGSAGRMLDEAAQRLEDASRNVRGTLFFGATDQFGEGLYDFVNLHRQAAGRESDLAKITEQLGTLIDPEKIIAPSLERLSQARSHWVPEGLSERLANLQKQFPGATIDDLIHKVPPEVEEAVEEYRFLWVEALKQISQQAGQTFASILAGQQSITKGLKSLLQQFTGILWGKIFAQGADKLIGSLLPSLAGKNRYGGTAFPSQAYLVGEAGPELFVPDRSGYVVRNDHLMGGGGNRQTVNVYVNGSPDKDALVATLDNYFRTQWREDLASMHGEG